MNKPQDSWDFQFDQNGSGRYKEKHWWQRKVLELHLLQRMLATIIVGSTEILEQVRIELGVGDGTLSVAVLNREAYSASKDNWQKFEHILQAAEDDVTAVLNMLQKWNTREVDRGQEKPRWTRNDERKYRGHINKFRAQTERQMWDLEIQRDSLRKLRETLTTSREKTRDDLEIKREENIRYFTYVTVIFLPLGFAASFYSMSGTPDHELIVSLVEFAAAAFAVTLALLFCAKMVFAMADVVLAPLQYLRKAMIQSVEKHVRATKKESLLIQDRINVYRKPVIKHINEASGDKSGSNSGPQTPSDEDSMSTSWFWLAYFLLELPARRMSSAFLALKDRKISAKAASTIVLGIIVFPIYVISRAIQIVIDHIFSSVRVLGKFSR